MKSKAIALCASLLALGLTPAAALASDGGSNGTLDQVQQATNTNSTSQSAESTATTKQVNVNAPISVLSKGSNNGDVHQSNDATTVAKSQNDNTTNQSNTQNQHGSVQGGGPDRRGDCGHHRKDRGDDRGDCGRKHRDGCHRCCNRCESPWNEGCASPLSA